MQGPVDTLLTRRDNASWDCTIDIVSNNFRILVTGEVAKTINWHVRWELVRAG
jgi:hypothetical protein